MTENNLLQKIELLVDPATAEKLFNNPDKLAELAFRRKDKKFLSFANAKIVNSNTSEQAAKKIMQAVTNRQISDNAFNESIHKLVNNLNLADKKLDFMNNTLKNMSFNLTNLANMTKRVQALSFVNIGVSIANIAVDAVGFIYIAQKMKGLSAQLNQIAFALEQLKDISVEDMRSDCEKLSLDYNTFVTKIHDRDMLDRDDLEEYLKRAKPFLSKLIRLLQNGTVDSEILLNMIFTLLPAYTSMLCVFLRAYYFDKHTTPLNYNNFLEIYQEINSTDFRNAVQDYYMVDKEFNYREIIDILNVQLYTVFSERLEIEDELTLLEVFGDEEYIAFEEALNQIVKNEFAEQADEIAKECGSYSAECKRVLALAV